MINKVGFAESNKIMIISQLATEDAIDFSKDLRSAINGFKLDSIHGVQISFKAPTSNGGYSSYLVNHSNKVLVKDGILVTIDADPLIKSGIIKLK